jgi:hypothetical protein
MSNITGRDGYIIQQALLYAIKYIDALPAKLRETSNQEDMVKILLSKNPNFVAEHDEMTKFMFGGGAPESVAVPDLADARWQQQYFTHRELPSVLRELANAG